MGVVPAKGERGNHALVVAVLVREDASPPSMNALLCNVLQRRV